MAKRKPEAETYSGLADAVKANKQTQVNKQRPRHNHKSYQNVMAMVRKYGKPDLFLTFTCNSNWKVIVDNLCPGDKALYRNDLIARVFRLKLNALLKDINVKKVLGVPIGHTMVTELQK